MTLAAVSASVALWALLVGLHHRRLVRSLRAILDVSKRHLPAWVAVLLAVCLAIPGPQDELLVLLIVGVFVAFKPKMRADLRREVSSAWCLT